MTDVRSVLKALPHHSDVYGGRAWPDDPNHYPVYARVFAALAPTSLFEVGAFLGYSAATAAAVVPDLERVGWVDDESGCRGSNAMAADNLRAARVAVGLPPLDNVLWWRGWPEPHVLAGYNLVHVDGDHRYDPCLTDLRRAVAMAPRYVIGHDLWLAGSGVRAAVEQVFGHDYLEVDLTHGLFVAAVGGDLAEARTRLVAAGCRVGGPGEVL